MLVPNIYSNVGDIATLVICLLLVIVLRSTYTIREKRLVMFKIADLGIFLAALFSIIAEWLACNITVKTVFFYLIMRYAKDISLFITFHLFCDYIYTLSHKGVKMSRSFAMTAGMVFSLSTLFTVIAPFTHWGIYVDSNLVVRNSERMLSPFAVGYACYAIIVIALMINRRSHFITKVFRCIMETASLSFGIIILQRIFNAETFTTLSFTFPLMAVLFMFHYNAYDVETGMLDDRSFNSYVAEHKGQKLCLIFLTLQDFELETMFGLSEEFYHFNERYFKKCATFRLKDSKVVVVFEKKDNPGWSRKIEQVLEDFGKLYLKYQIDFKIVITSDFDNLNDGNDYLGLDIFLEEKMSDGEVRTATENDVRHYLHSLFLLKEMRSMQRDGNLDDNRIKVYCQPVLNSATGTFTTAEVLMRLVLPTVGIVSPNDFIPLAEKNDMIHFLSQVILNKSCQLIKRLDENGYKLVRLSVNFSITELKNPMFCDDVLGIIAANEISPNRIAIELTESRNESDYEHVKSIMGILHKAGIKFYLDDFGTGYSNIERILGLPIDIIKFDRSLTRMASKDENSHMLVKSFSEIFWKAGYQVLFEGIEDEQDENFCIEMHADYLQGFKYSTPVPESNIVDFLEKE